MNCVSDIPTENCEGSRGLSRGLLRGLSRGLSDYGLRSRSSIPWPSSSTNYYCIIFFANFYQMHLPPYRLIIIKTKTSPLIKRSPSHPLNVSIQYDLQSQSNTIHCLERAKLSAIYTVCWLERHKRNASLCQCCVSTSQLTSEIRSENRRTLGAAMSRFLPPSFSSLS